MRLVAAYRATLLKGKTGARGCNIEEVMDGTVSVELQHNREWKRWRMRGRRRKRREGGRSRI